MMSFPAGFAYGEAIAVCPRPWLSLLLTAFVVAGCASPHPAPIQHRIPPGPIASRPAVPVPVAPGAPAVPVGAVPGAAPDGVVASGPQGVQTTPIARGAVETRPLPGSPTGSTQDATGASTNLLKTEPKVLKQPYSEAALAQMRAAAPPSDVPPVALAAPDVASTTTGAAASPPQASSKTPADASATSGEWIWPAAGPVVQDFSQPSSMGISIAGKPGDPIVAVHDGRVIFSGAGPRSYGNLVIVKHGDDTLSVYAHNRALLVKEGQTVQRGQRIAELGTSGTDSPKLHFEIRKDGRPIDPRKVLPPR